MSLEYIRKTYNVPAFRGVIVEFYPEMKPLRGVIVGSRGAHLRVRFKQGEILSLHPTWRVGYVVKGLSASLMKRIKKEQYQDRLLD